MNNQEVQRYFNEYILPPRGFIYNDVQRELNLARSGNGGGNFLSALGLLCYTEFMGAMYLGGRKSTSRNYFTAFFRSMGEPYQHLLGQTDVYKIFRCGMAHTYFPENCVVAMLNTKKYPVGIVINPNGKHLFIVEKYFEDFMNSCQQLYGRMIEEQNPYLPST
jgi:hypothetical protein